VSKEAVGLTKGTGWQAGVRRTLPIRPENAWDFLLSPQAVRIWLGAAPKVKLAAGAEFRLTGDTRCKITVFRPGSHLRMQWQPADYSKPAVLQVRVIPADEKTAFSFHQENLPDAAARQQRIAFYQDVLAQLGKLNN
jgi:activator of HSP90 ATPase